jgi:hemerythrin
MALITWKDSYSVNIKELDNQHKKLIDLINVLHDSMKEGKGKEAICNVLDQLVHYTATHFAAEEKLFLKHGYPGSQDHYLKHQDLIEQVSSLQKRFESGESVLTIEVMAFLKDWLTDHILASDKKYTSFLNSKGVM